MPVYRGRLGSAGGGVVGERVDRRGDEVRLAVMGSPGVGKSAAVVRYLTCRFIWEYDPTLECAYHHVANVDDEAVVLEILDTAGQIPGSFYEGSPREGQARWADGFLLVYSVTDQASFDQISQLLLHLQEIRGNNPPVMIIANKSDLEAGREVRREDGERLAEELGVGFIELSVCEGMEDVEEAFREVVREVRRRRLVASRPRRRSSASQVRHVLTKVLTKIQNG